MDNPSTADETPGQTDGETGGETDGENDGPAGAGLLPDWYMPAPMVGAPLLRGWRRRVALLIIASFVLLSAYGLCSTYGWVGFG